MPEHETGGGSLFRQWQELSSGLLQSGEASAGLRARCEELFAAWGRFARTWSEAAGASSAQPGGPFDPAGWMDAGGAAGFGDLWRWFGADSGADPWTAEWQALRGSAEWLAYGRALERYNSVMAGAWLKAFGRFTAGLGTEGAPDWTAMQARWQAAADAELAAAQGSEAFLDAQRELIRARLACTALLRARAESLAAILGLPTRVELDSLHEAVHRLGREVRDLRARLGPGTGDQVE
jgi:hypothetical protein